MQPGKRGKRRRRKKPYLFCSGCAVKNRMTVIGYPMERYKINQTGADRLYFTHSFLGSRRRPTFCCFKRRKAFYLNRKLHLLAEMQERLRIKSFAGQTSTVRRTVTRKGIGVGRSPTNEAFWTKSYEWLLLRN